MYSQCRCSAETTYNLLQNKIKKHKYDKVMKVIVSEPNEKCVPFLSGEFASVQRGSANRKSVGWAVCQNSVILNRLLWIRWIKWSMIRSVSTHYWMGLHAVSVVVHIVCLFFILFTQTSCLGAVTQVSTNIWGEHTGTAGTGGHWRTPSRYDCWTGKALFFLFFFQSSLRIHADMSWTLACRCRDRPESVDRHTEKTCHANQERTSSIQCDVHRRVQTWSGVHRSWRTKSWSLPSSTSTKSSPTSTSEETLYVCVLLCQM